MSATMQTLPKKNWWEVGTTGATDTLGGESAQGPWSDNTPRQGGSDWSKTPYKPPMSVDYMPGYGPNGQTPGGSTQGGGTFGTTYRDPGGGWNPWSLYDGRQGYDGTAADGHYNAQADTAKWQLNGQPENDRNRVWRWTLDALGPNPGGQPPERVKQVFLEQVARLKRDYANTPGMTWQGSAFSGYDKFAQGGQAQGAGVGGAASGAAQAGSSAVAQAAQAQQGGNAVANPFFTPQTPTPAAGTDPAAAAAQATGLKLGQQITGGGGTAGTSGAPTGAYYKSDPSVAVTQFLQQHGVNIGDHGPFADFLRKLATGVATPAMSILANNPNGQMSGDQLNNLPGMLSNLIYGNGGQVFGNLRDFANTSMGQFGATRFQGMDAGAVQSLLQTINALKTMGDNPYMQNFTQNALQDLFTRYKLADFTSMTPPGGAVGKSQNADWFLNPQNDPYGLWR